MRFIDWGYRDGDLYKIHVSLEAMNVLREHMWEILKSKVAGRYPKELQQIKGLVEELIYMDELLHQPEHYIELSKEEIDKIEEELFPSKEGK